MGKLDTLTVQTITKESTTILNSAREKLEGTIDSETHEASKQFRENAMEQLKNLNVPNYSEVQDINKVYLKFCDQVNTILGIAGIEQDSL